MNLEVSDYPTTEAQLTAFAANRAPELGTSPVELLGELVGVEAQLAQGLGATFERAGNDALPTSDTSYEGLAAWADSIGLSSGQGVGKYGPRVATPAQGATGALSGALGITFPLGQLAQGPGGVQVKLRAAVTLPGTFGDPGTSQAPVDTCIWDAVEPGAQGNLRAGAVLTLIGPPAGADPSVTLASDMAVKGADAELAGPLLVRIQNKMQRPPNGGNGTDYAGWVVEAVDAAGNPLSSAELFASVYPNYHGDGSPMVVVTQAGSGRARRPSASLLAAITTYVTGSTGTPGQRPISHDFTALAPFMPAERALVIRCRTIPSKIVYAFDWVSGGVGLEMLATSVGPPFEILLVGLAPRSLKLAIDAGQKPRIQIDTRVFGDNLPIGQPVPPQVSVVAWADAAGRTTLTLDTLPNSWTPPSLAAPERIYPGGPIVTAVGAAILAKVDSLGPSRQSGLADPAQLWQDTLGLTAISTAAETVLDEDGLTHLVDHCIAGGTLIGIGAAAPAATDVTATDTTILGPEMLYAGRILVLD